MRINKKKQKWIYFWIVMVPSILTILLFYRILLNNEKEDYYQHLEWIASIHQNQIDQFIGETITGLNILAFSLEPMLNDLDSVKMILKKTADQDPRYGGMYILDSDGNVITGTNDLLKHYNFKNMDYFQEVLLTKHTAVSNQQEKIKDNQHVIAVASPILSNNKVIAVLVAHIQVDYIRNIMKQLTPDQAISFENSKGKTIFTVTKPPEHNHTEKKIRYPLEQLPWNIVLTTDNRYNREVIRSTILFAIIPFIFFHILFLVFKYFMLKRQTKLERVQTEAQKLELIGTLAAGIAHEIRNPLTGIKGLVQLLSEKYQDQKDRFYFSVINKEIARINQIVSEFLILGKPTVQKMSYTDIRDIIIDVNPLIYSEANLYNVQYEYSLPEEPAIIYCTVDQMKQVVLNLTKNALEAMQDGGILRLTVSKASRSCLITITDNGAGISQENLEKIFTPFFTSKENGTGLGLVVCKRIIESFDGEIAIESQLNIGTQVRITMPLKEETIDENHK
jgi:two-component system, sporulation sensor kinase D